MKETTNKVNESSPEKKKKKSGNKKYALGRVGVIIFVLLVIWWFNNYTLKTTEVTIRSDKINKSVRIAVISDLHATSHSISNKRIVKRIKKADPDIVIILGDMYTSGSSWDEIQIPIDLTADIVGEDLPVYFVTGEHDTDPEYIKKIRDTGAHVMNYESEITEINGNKFQIMGIDNVYYSDTFDLRNEFTIRKDCFNILLAHIPNYEKFADFGAELTLCADTHGGMIQLPFGFGSVFCSDEYDKGLFDYKGGVMFITSGIGDSPAPIRFNNRPEVAVIDLVSY